MRTPAYGYSLLKELIKALGLEEQNGINKIVIVADMKDVARAYIRRVIMSDELPAVAGAIKLQSCRTLELNEQTLEVEES